MFKIEALINRVRGNTIVDNGVNKEISLPEADKLEPVIYNPNREIEILTSREVIFGSAVGLAGALTLTFTGINRGYFDPESQVYFMTMVVGTAVGLTLGVLWWKVTHDGD